MLHQEDLPGAQEKMEERGWLKSKARGMSFVLGKPGPHLGLKEWFSELALAATPPPATVGRSRPTGKEQTRQSTQDPLHPSSAQPGHLHTVGTPHCQQLFLEPTASGDTSPEGAWRTSPGHTLPPTCSWVGKVRTLCKLTKVVTAQEQEHLLSDRKRSQGSLEAGAGPSA